MHQLTLHDLGTASKLKLSTLAFIRQWLVEPSQHRPPAQTNNRVGNQKTICLYVCIDIGSNQNPVILKQVEGIAFPHLLCIDLSDNGIASVEAISRVHFPTLQEFVICTHGTMKVGTV